LVQVQLLVRAHGEAGKLMALRVLAAKDRHTGAIDPKNESGID